MLLQNKNVVVTGCNKGIGKKILDVFSENKATIFACVRNIDKEFKSYCQDLEKKYGNKILPIELDLNNSDQIKEAANILNTQLKEEYPDQDIMINTLSTLGYQPMRTKTSRGPGSLDVEFDGSHLGEIAIELAPGEVRPISTEEVVRRWRELTPDIPGVSEVSFFSSLSDKEENGSCLPDNGLEPISKAFLFCNSSNNFILRVIFLFSNLIQILLYQFFHLQQTLKVLHHEHLWLLGIF